MYRRVATDEANDDDQACEVTMISRWLMYTLAATVMLTSAAEAHDANLARWDLSSSGDTLELVLRTSGHGLYASLQAATPGRDWANLSAEAYDRQLQSFLADVAVIEEDGRRLDVAAMHSVHGHESTISLTLRRSRAGPLGAIRLDLHRYTDRPNQHHLVFVHRARSRDRVMLAPDSGYVLVQPDAAQPPTPAAQATASTTDPQHGKRK